MASLWIRTGDRSVVYQILEDELTVGCDAANQVRVRAEGVGLCHLRLSRHDGGFRVETEPGCGLRVNGTRTTSHALQNGDQIEVGEAILVFRTGDGLEREEVAASAPAGDIVIAPIRGVPMPRGGARAGARSRGSGRRRGMPQWLLFSNLMAVAAIGVFVLVRMLQSSAFGPDPQDLVTLAESQFRNGNVQAARATLDAARESGPDARTRERIDELRARIDTSVHKIADRGVLEPAGDGFTALQAFERAWLTKDPGHRGAARELVRRARSWIERFRDACNRYEEYRPMAASVAELVARYEAAARLDQPDDADDVVFLAETHVRLRQRRYPAAIAVLEQWLATAAAGSPDAAAVRARLSALHAEGRAWVDDRVRAAERMVERGQTAPAIDELRAVVDQGGLPEWLDEARALLAKLGG